MNTKKLPCIVIVGRPNVGKSSLFNRVIGKREAVVEDTPGITRDRLYREAEWNNRRFQLVDTGGILFGDDDPLVEQIRVQANIALAEADVVIFMADATDGLTPGDGELADALRGSGKTIFVAVNKADNESRDGWAAEFYALGIGEVLPISALHGRGVADLFDLATEHLPIETEVAEEGQQPLRVAIVGRPNVGKSSMLNAFVGENRSIVSDIPGTTRDAIDTEIQFRGETVTLIDTAGLRRRGKIQGSIEYYMAMRAERAMSRAGVALVIVDGHLGLADGDKRIAKAAHDAGRACVLAINKWDLVEPPDGCPKTRTPAKLDFAKQVRDEFPDLSYAVLCFTSAKHETGLQAALEACVDASESHHLRMSTSVLNRIVREACFEKPHSRKGKPFRIYYATQARTAPPTILLFCNDPEIVHFSYKRYIEKCIRKEFPMEGTPVRIEFRSSHGNR